MYMSTNPFPMFLRTCWGKKDMKGFTANLQVLQGHVPSLQTSSVSKWYTLLTDLYCRTMIGRQADRDGKADRLTNTHQEMIAKHQPSLLMTKQLTRYEDKIIALYMKHSTYGEAICKPTTWIKTGLSKTDLCGKNLQTCSWDTNATNTWNTPWEHMKILHRCQSLINS